MTNYLVIYRAPVSASDQMAGASPEEAQAGMDACMSWAGRAGSAIVDMGSPLARVDTIGADLGDGELAIAGFSVMQADSADALREALDGHPHLMMPGAALEVLEYLSLPGM